MKLKKRNMIMLGIVSGLALFLIGNDYRSKADSETTVLSPQAPVLEQVVIMKNIRFAPETITVKRGTTVIWTNEDSINHQISGDSGLILFDSAAIRPGEIYSFTFNTAGTYNYHCNIHPFMRGKVVVVE